MLRRIATILLGAPVLVSPWLLGGVKESTHVYVAVAVALAFAFWGLSVVVDRGASLRTRFTVAHLPLLLGILLGVGQLIPLPETLAGWIAPHSVSLRRELTDDASTIEGSSARDAAKIGAAPEPSFRLSLRPSETRYQIGMLVLALAVFWLAGQLLQTRRAIEIAFVAIAVNGGLLALFGIMQSLSWNGRLFWIGRRMDGGAPFATYINRNNAAGYLNLCLAAAVAMAVWQLRKHSSTKKSSTRSRHASRPRSSDTKTSDVGRTAPGSRRRRSHRSETSRPIEPGSIALLFIAVLTLAGIIGSLSRGGTVAAIVSLLFVLPIVFAKGSESRPLPSPL